jgi:hypothetical protein
VKPYQTPLVFVNEPTTALGDHLLLGMVWRLAGAKIRVRTTRGGDLLTYDRPDAPR